MNSPSCDGGARHDEGQAGLRISAYAGDRLLLLPLFELADDSLAQIEQYFGQGQVLVASKGDFPCGHAQLIEISPDEFELKSIAVIEACQGNGIGQRLLDEAVRFARQNGARRLSLVTAAASIAALRFYMRAGFRVTQVHSNAFSRDRGYDEGIEIDGIPLNDALKLELAL
jgi:ribosomal protein S18 acetylase RimI-like enzyme